MPPALTGPRLPPRSGTAKQLVVFLHGYGADGNDLIEIGRQWQRWLPDAAFVAPNAPELMAMGGGWAAMVRPHLPRSARALARRQPRRPRASTPGSTWSLPAHDLPASKLALVGFSQGTMMALHLGLRRA